MLVTRLRLRDFRSYADADAALGAGVTIVHGPNGAGKTNLLEALYFGCTGHSCRTTNERDVVRFGAPAARVEVETRSADGRAHSLSVGFAPGEVKRMTADGAPVQRLSDAAERPLVCVFLPDRLELVKGPPALRRSHLDQVVAAVWPSRAPTRAAYARALAQRNALLLRIRSGRASRESLPAWDAELAGHGIALRDNRAAATGLIAERFQEQSAALGLTGSAAVRYRPRSRAADATELAGELGDRADSDVERGFTEHGPHRDDLLLERDGRPLRSFGSQGEQRLALLALLLAERAALADARGASPLMLLDDVMSELDAARRARLADTLSDGGQSVVTATELDHVPGGRGSGVARLAVAAGAVHSDSAAVTA